VKRTGFPRLAKIGALKMTADTAAAPLKEGNIIFSELSLLKSILMLQMD
jgi:hypothetical protein